MANGKINTKAKDLKIECQIQKRASFMIFWTRS